VVSLPENGTELKTILGQLDNALLVKALEVARKVYKVILEQTDETLAKHHGPGLQIEHLRACMDEKPIQLLETYERQYP